MDDAPATFRPFIISLSRLIVLRGHDFCLSFRLVRRVLAFESTEHYLPLIRVKLSLATIEVLDELESPRAMKPAAES